jgi:hypothetical protein
MTLDGKMTIRVYCEEPDLPYAEAFLDHLSTRVLAKRHDGQFLIVVLDISEWGYRDGSIHTHLIEEGLSRCVRRHKRPSKPPKY